MLILSLIFALQSGVAVHGADIAPARPAAGAIPVACAAFRKNNDGSWTSIHKTRVGKVSISAGGTFFPGVRLDGVDVAAQLNAQCTGKKAQAGGHAETTGGVEFDTSQ